MSDIKEEILKKINKAEKNINNLKNDYKNISIELLKLKKNRLKNHVIILLSFILSILINGLVSDSLLRFIVFLIPNISLISYEITTKDERKKIKQLTENRYLLNKYIFTEKHFLEIYSKKLNNFDNQNNIIIFSKHENIKSMNIENDFNKSDNFVKKLK